MFCKKWLCWIFEVEGTILWTPESLEYSDFHLDFWEFPGSLALRMSQLCLRSWELLSLDYLPWPFDPWRNSSFHLSHPYSLGTLLFYCQILLGYNWLSSFGSFPVTAWLVNSSELLLLSPRIVPLCHVLATIMGVRVWKNLLFSPEEGLWIQGQYHRGTISGLSAASFPQVTGQIEGCPGQGLQFFLRSPVFLIYLRVSSKELGDSLWSQPLTDGDWGENGRLGKELGLGCPHQNNLQIQILFIRTLAIEFRIHPDNPG